MAGRHSRFPAVNRNIPRGGRAVIDAAPSLAATPAPPPPPPPAPEPEPVEVEVEVEETEEEIATETTEQVEADDNEVYSHVGGGWYELADGRRIQGLDNVKAALEEDGSPTGD